jgi:Rrf2 family nitric oxide-sensitive transcriptional repressor
MISQTAEYALRAVVHLASADKALTTERIAEGTSVPAGYLAKIMQALARAGHIKSQRGLHGGFTLLSDPKVLSVYDIIQIFDPIVRLDGCPLGISEHGTNLCPLHRALDNQLASMERTFKGMTIRGLLNDRKNPSVPLCPFPRVASAAPQEGS